MAIFKDGLIRQGASGSSAAPHQIDQSIRFNALDSPYLSKTFASKGSPKKFSLSWWSKLSYRTINATSESQMFFIAYHSSGYQTDFSIQSAARASGVVHTFRTYAVTTGGGACWDLRTTQLFRDPAAWYHFLVVSDTDNAIASERFRLFINGQRVTDFGAATYPGSGVEPVWNNSTNVTHYIGSRGGNTNTRFDGYMAEIVHIDGQALDPSSFGETNSNGIWIPINVSGLTFGTNGFHIDGSDSSDLGKNVATGNTFATFASSGLQTNDQRVDTPTNNQITFNTLNNQRGGGTPSNGDLDYVGPGTRTNISLTANVPSTGKWAVAYKVAQVSTGSGWQIGISTASDSDFGDAAGSNEDLDLVRMQPSSSDLYINDAVNSSGIDPSLPITTSDEFWVAVDMDSGNVYLGIYDASDTSMKWAANDGGIDGDPGAGTNPTVTFNTTQMPRDDVVFSVGSKQTNQNIYLQRSTDVSGTTPTGFTYFENVKDIL